ncbi:MAG: hypothetical protein IJJ23_11885 [Clostridia bacterium]|nr:hypothetical protein [Clostridia bacterium]
MKRIDFAALIRFEHEEIFMGGILFFALFELSGCGLMFALFRRQGSGVRLWLGLSAGCLLLMWLPSLYAFAFDFTMKANLLALGTAVLIGAGGVFSVWRRGGCAVSRDQSSDTGDPPLKLVLYLVLPLLIVMAYMQYTHTLRPVDGALHTGQSTYGDMNLHLGIATGLVNQAYPPDYTILPGTLLGYPFLMDAMSASLYMMGLPLRWAFILPGVVMSGLVMWGFVIFSWSLTRSRRATCVAYLLLFLNGGLGFIYVIDQAIANPQAFLQVFSGFYKAPANLVDYNIRWVNVLVDMLLPQRTILSGWMMVIPALWMLLNAMRSEKWRHFFLLGLWAGSMPMIHTHSFLALGLISAGAMVSFTIHTAKKDRLRVMGLFVVYGATAVILALPQLMTWTFPQTVGGGSLRVHFNWVNNRNGRLIDEYFWFWIKNVGPVYLLMIPAALMGNRRQKALALGAALVYCVAEAILFQPNDYDNNKLFYVAFITMLPLVGQYLTALYNRLRGLPGRRLFASVFLLVSILSGGLSIVRECVSDYQLYGASEVEAVEWLQDNAPEHAVILTGTQHNNAPASLGGFRLVCGTPTFLYFHGVNYQRQQADARMMFENPRENAALYNEYDVQYIYVSSHERSSMAVNEEEIIELYPLVFESGDVRIYETDIQ